MEKAFQSLKRVGLLRQIIFDDEIRYTLKDDSLPEFLIDLRVLVGNRMYDLQYEWSFFRAPTYKEEVLAARYYREQKEQFLQKFELIRHDHFKRLCKQAGMPYSRKQEVQNDPEKIKRRNDHIERFNEGINLAKEKYGKTILKKEEYFFVQEIVRELCPALLD